MMRIFVCIAVAMLSVASAEELPTFREYVKKFGKNFRGDEYTRRERIYKNNLVEIQQHNKLYDQGKVSYKMGVNKFTATDAKEMKTRFGFNKKMAQHTSKLGKKLEEDGFNMLPVDQLPKKVDWREEGIVTAVKDQGHCGSCWAFSTTAVLESHVAKDSGLLFDLSPQQIASCAPNPEQCGGTGGCEGATYDVSFGYAASITNQDAGTGLYQEFQYAYNSYYGQDYTCQTVDEPVAGITGYTTLATNNYTELMNAVAQSGPVAVVVDASKWGAYDGGIFDGCEGDEHPDINHGVVIVGYGSCRIHGDYWIIRNSWSPEWGEKGYIRLRRSNNDDENCGMDITPQDGTACAGDDTPQRVCGSCGVLFNSVIPNGAYAYATDEDGRKP